MKIAVSPHAVASLFLGLIAPLSAQNLQGIRNHSESSHDPSALSESSTRELAHVPIFRELPAFEKIRGEIDEMPPLVAAQNSRNLGEIASSSRSVESVVNLDVLKNPSPYRRMAVNGSVTPYDTETNSLTKGLAMVSATYREAGSASQTTECPEVALAVEQRIKLDTGKTLETVELEIAANPGCACEIVKSAIEASGADVAMVVAIVETAAVASPESMRIVSQCAIAASPESLSAVQALLARLDPNAGESGYSSKSAKSSKDSKGAKVASIIAPPLPNPLDLPPPEPPLPPLPPINPDPVTAVDPCIAVHGVYKP
jgi:hypothetical protein